MNRYVKFGTDDTLHKFTPTNFVRNIFRVLNLEAWRLWKSFDDTSD